MRFIFFIFIIYSLTGSSQDFISNEIYLKNFPIDKIILGEWQLEKVEIIGLNQNDSTSIVSTEPGNDKLLFSDKMIKVIDYSSILGAYLPSRQLYYKIEQSPYSLGVDLIIIDKKDKRTFESFTIVFYSFDKLLFESIDVRSVLGQNISRTRFTYVKIKSDHFKIYHNWIQTDSLSFNIFDSKDTLWHSFSKKVEPTVSNQKTFQNVQTKISFNSENMFTYSSVGQYTGVYISGDFIVETRAKRIYFISNKITIYEYDFDENGNLKLRFDSVVTANGIK